MEPIRSWWFFSLSVFKIFSTSSFVIRNSVSSVLCSLFSNVGMFSRLSRVKTLVKKVLSRNYLSFCLITSPLYLHKICMTLARKHLVEMFLGPRFHNMHWMHRSVVTTSSVTVGGDLTVSHCNNVVIGCCVEGSPWLTANSRQRTGGFSETI